MAGVLQGVGEGENGVRVAHRQTLSAFSLSGKQNKMKKITKLSGL